MDALNITLPSGWSAVPVLKGEIVRIKEPSGVLKGYLFRRAWTTKVYTYIDSLYPDEFLGEFTSIQDAVDVLVKH